MQFLLGLLVGGALGCVATALYVASPDPEITDEAEQDDLLDAMEALDDDESDEPDEDDEEPEDCDDGATPVQCYCYDGAVIDLHWSEVRDDE